MDFTNYFQISGMSPLKTVLKGRKKYLVPRMFSSLFIHVFISSQTPKSSVLNHFTMFSNEGMHQNYLEALLQLRLRGPVPRVSGSVRLGEDQEFAFPPSSRVIMMLQVQEPHFENQ